jgi:hypothetical protein
MSVELNHTIVWCSDRRRSAGFMAETQGLPGPRPLYHFPVGEAEFDGIYGHIGEKGLDHWADPARTRPGEINRNHGGRGVYFLDLDGHVLEALTRPYGSGGQALSRLYGGDLQLSLP